VIPDVDWGLVETIGKELEIPSPVARVLVNRGVRDPEEGRSFLLPSLRGLHPPEAMADMDKAVGRILEAMEKKEPLFLYGDYDADGLTSVALIKSFFSSIGVEATPVIPNREVDGYGFHSNLLPDPKGGRGLVITADCGISDCEEIRRATSRGLDVIVTDHHEPGEVLPQACAVLNPKRKDNSYPFRELAGVGVVFLLVWALAKRLKEKGFWPKGKEPSLKRFLDLVALGTVADQAPLIKENRILVKHGLSEMDRIQRPGIMALMEVAATRSISVGSITFQLAPRINAPGRLDSAMTALELLLSQDLQEARELASILDGMNRRRQEIEEEVLREAELMASEHAMAGKGALVLARRGWHPGVLGIVASRLVERFEVPVVLISLEEKIGKGSARAPDGYDMMDGLRHCSQFLERFGGHRSAAGLKIQPDALEEFREALSRHAKEVLGPRRGHGILRIDDKLEPNQLDENLLNSLIKLEPHGIGNPEPIFEVGEMEVMGSRRIENRHIKFSMRRGNSTFEAIGFNLAGQIPEPTHGRVRVACTPQINEWNGKRTVQLKLKDLQVL
jgi:single-stranded-DNA-specific exonuclease